MIRRRDVIVIFFQADDGMRDLTVTGVQTCALPICGRHAGRRRPGAGVRRSQVLYRAGRRGAPDERDRSEEHTSELQSQSNLVCRLLLEKKKKQHEMKNADTTLEPVTTHASSDTLHR